MKTSCLEIKIGDLVDRFSTREAGAKARAKLLEMMGHATCIFLDMQGARLTPSFADECFGLLAHEVGLQRVREALKMKNLNVLSKPIINHVVARRGAAGSAAA